MVKWTYQTSFFDEEVFGLNACKMAKWLQADLYLVHS